MQDTGRSEMVQRCALNRQLTVDGVHKQEEQAPGSGSRPKLTNVNPKKRGGWVMLMRNAGSGAVAYTLWPCCALAYTL
eukprot:scaffold96568_cov16-Tisochrysis_lutea.AAC.1